MKRAYKKIESFLDVLQVNMEANNYKEAEKVVSHLDIYFCFMNDEQKDYYQVAKDAIEEGRPWII